MVCVLVYVREPSVPLRMLTPSSFQSWDTELEAFAQAYAEKCIWDHNKERGRRGENLFAMAPTLDLEFAVEDWNGEEKYYNLTTSTCDPGQMCGHYTQVPGCWGGGMGLLGKELVPEPQFLPKSLQRDGEPGRNHNDTGRPEHGASRDQPFGEDLF